MDNLENRIYMTHLFDLYGASLTKKQQLIFKLYYYEDLSLAEISERGDVSRQGVHDHLKRAENRLSCLEEELKIKAKLDKIAKEVTDLSELLKNENIDKDSPTYDVMNQLIEEVSYGF